MSSSSIQEACVNGDLTYLQEKVNTSETSFQLCSKDISLLCENGHHACLTYVLGLASHARFASEVLSFGIYAQCLTCLQTAAAAGANLQNPNVLAGLVAVDFLAGVQFVLGAASPTYNLQYLGSLGGSSNASVQYLQSLQ